MKEKCYFQRIGETGIVILTTSGAAKDEIVIDIIDMTTSQFQYYDMYCSGVSKDTTFPVIIFGFGAVCI